ncbi:hypothetical protein PMM47T1_15206 [Pseudomonas sp. M47T1]|uniref:hypothetical protein n=1 Tax=unclassified Pseudomonas TaxID=196821 RepID=UPI0002607298|nr:hypothetical protein [Pseudomonas sp. M47T1]EIK95745.1 hypothetical protein PMM47T1_15206 [Pseudomonas sp. M47T1]
MKDLIRSVGLTFLLDHKVLRSAYSAAPVFPAFSTYCDFNVVQTQVAGYAFGFGHPVAVQLPWQAVEGGL